MPKRVLFMLLLLLLAGCKHGRKVSTSFYYWKTVYRQSPAESPYMQQLHCQKIYVRIMDVNMGDNGEPAPVAPVVFEQAIPAGMQLVPVVYIVNDVIKILPKAGLADMARKIVKYVDAKVQQAGKSTYNELQVDCDWTADTRQNYFYLLEQVKQQLKGKTLSVTLRLHQVKNKTGSGIPPVNNAMLMCYNMGNLRKYGAQNSIIDVAELKRYLGDNLTRYPMKLDVGLPLFSWAVVFRDKQYIGIARQINWDMLHNKDKFTINGSKLYFAKVDMPQYGLKVADEVRWEDAPLTDIEQVAAYLGKYLKKDDMEVVYFHLDADVLKKYRYEELEKVGNLLR